mmetsp:Transcript_10250/g.41750  ORF Transcript_10250/g.41750 Transcript_10250/m.41750 type:complete len:215 (-) Transcript_10250:1425-2069(-)
MATSRAVTLSCSCCERCSCNFNSRCSPSRAISSRILSFSTSIASRPDGRLPSAVALTSVLSVCDSAPEFVPLCLLAGFPSLSFSCRSIASIVACFAVNCAVSSRTCSSNAASCSSSSSSSSFLSSSAASELEDPASRLSASALAASSRWRRRSSSASLRAFRSSMRRRLVASSSASLLVLEEVAWARRSSLFMRSASTRRRWHSWSLAASSCWS